MATRTLASPVGRPHECSAPYAPHAFLIHFRSATLCTLFRSTCFAALTLPRALTTLLSSPAAPFVPPLNCHARQASCCHCRTPNVAFSQFSRKLGRRRRGCRQKSAGMFLSSLVIGERLLTPLSHSRRRPHPTPPRLLLCMDPVSGAAHMAGGAWQRHSLAWFVKRGFRHRQSGQAGRGPRGTGAT